MLRPSVGPRHRQADTKLRLFIYTPTVMDLIFYTAPIPGGPGCGQPALPYRRREATRNYRYSQRGLVAHHLNNGYNEPAIRRARQRGKTLLRHSYLPAVNPTRRCNACRVTVVRMSLSFSWSRRLVLVATRFTFIVWSTFSTI